MIKAIVFDFAGVIGPGALMGWVKKNTTVENKMITRLAEKSHLWDLGKIDEEEFQQVISKITGVEEDKIWDTIWGTATINKDLISLIKKLKKKYKIILFSDNFAPYLHKQIDALGIRDLFDEIIISSDYHIKKINKNFFEKMLSISGFSRNEVLFTDDSQINIEVAENFGIRSHLFKDVAGFTNFLKTNDIAIS